MSPFLNNEVNLLLKESLMDFPVFGLNQVYMKCLFTVMDYRAEGLLKKVKDCQRFIEFDKRVWSMGNSVVKRKIQNRRDKKNVILRKSNDYFINKDDARMVRC